MIRCTTRSELAAALRALRAEGKTVGFAPTMGALHAGHLSLMSLAGQQADAVVASIFVNPTQFGPNEDFSRYPRQEARDLALLESSGVAVAYLPEVSQIYAPDASTRVVVDGLSERLCGAFRPGHFSGVATIVTKLLMQVMPDIAVFGEKDYQQLQVIRRLVRDLDLPVRILPAPILRDPDGLALSSRNQYLSPQARHIAPALVATLQETRAAMKPGEDATPLLEKAREALIMRGFSRLDYLEFCDGESLTSLREPKEGARLLAAVWIENTRLIDNLAWNA